MIQRDDGSGTTGFQYDALNRQTGKNIGSATVSCPSSPSNSQLCYEYDTAGNLISMSDGRGTTTYSYDPANNLLSMVEGATGNTDRFAYNKANQRIDTWYDATGTPTTGTDNCPTGQTISTASKPTGFAGHLTYCYDLDGRLMTIKGSRASSDSTLLENLSYSYLNGASHTSQVFSRTDNLTGKTTTYTYPHTATTGQGGRLASAITSSGGPAYYYCYDADGNILVNATSSVTCSSAAAQHSYDAANQLTDTGTAYDEDGNLTASPGSSPALDTLNYDGADMTSDITPNGASTDYFTYADSQTERVSQSQPSATSYSNGLGIQSQTDSSGTSYFETDPAGTLISQVTPSGEYYYFGDNIGSVLALVDTNGTQVAAYSYDPYGGHATVGAASAPNTDIADGNPFRYAGSYYDTATGLNKMGVRYYDPTLGRFTQTDPTAHLLDLKQGNRYGYASDDPIDGSDPTGETTWRFGNRTAEFVAGALLGVDTPVVNAEAAYFVAAIETVLAFTNTTSSQAGAQILAKNGPAGVVIDFGFGLNFFNLFHIGSPHFDVYTADGPNSCYTLE